MKDVSFELRRGECLGLIGRNGAGKTTLLRMLNGLIKPDTGKIEMRGQVGDKIQCARFVGAFGNGLEIVRVITVSDIFSNASGKELVVLHDVSDLMSQ